MFNSCNEVQFWRRTNCSCVQFTYVESLTRALNKPVHSTMHPWYAKQLPTLLFIATAFLKLINFCFSFEVIEVISLIKLAM